MVVPLYLNENEGGEMELCFGNTRVVILFGNYAIKIARFHPIRPFVRLIQRVQKGEVQQGLRIYHSDPYKAALRYIGKGVVANRTEHRLYKQYGHEKNFAPTLFMLFGGLVNVQLRGQPTSGEEACGHWLWRVLQDAPPTITCREDALQHKQFCVIGSKVCLVDYGNETLEEFLAQRKM